MRITVVTGDESGARFTRNLLDHLERSHDLTGSDVTVVANTGDDISLWGLRLCPDLDLLVETLGTAKGAGPGSSHVVGDELAALGLEPQWYPVTDREVAVHLARTAWLSRGDSLSEVTARLARGHGVPDTVRILPVSDIPIETHAVLDGAEEQHAVHVQQWRRELGCPDAARFVVAGLDRADAAPGVLDAIRGADLVLLAPSDPVLSLGIVLGVPGVRDALRGTSAPVVGVSPVLDESSVPPSLAASLATVGVATTPSGVRGLFTDLLNDWVADGSDPAGLAATALEAGISLRS